MQRVLVAGATGTIGAEVVRAPTRDPARARLSEGVEVVVGGLARPESLVLQETGS